MDRRPTGVVVSAVVLGCVSLALLATALLTLVGAYVLQRVPADQAARSGAAPPAAFLLACAAISALLSFAMAAWSATTALGLLHMRSWARISILVLAGCFAALGLIAALGLAGSQAMLSSMALPSGVDIAHVRFVVLFWALLFLCVAAIGIWWLIYFTRRPIRHAFLLAAASPPEPRPQPTGHTTPPSSLADFTLAEPLPDPDLPNPDDALGGPPIVIPGWTAAITAGDDAPPPRRRKRPTSTTIIGIVLIVGAFFALLEALLPMPLFFFGAVLVGWPAHLTMVAWAIATGYAGFGLIQLKRPAWWLTVALFGLSFLNAILLLLPGYRARMLDYSLGISRSMSLAIPTVPSTGLPAPTLQPQMLTFFLIIGLFFGAIFSVFLLILLARARWAFQSRPHK